MIDDPVLKRLAAADPAASVDPAPDEALLTRLLDAPRERRPVGRRRIRVLGAAALVAAAALAAVAVVVLSSADPEREVVAPREREAAPGAIRHTLVEVQQAQSSASGVRRETSTIEEWRRGDEIHVLQRWVAANGRETAALDRVIGADGAMRQVDRAGGYQVVRPADGADAASVIELQRQGWLDQFRKETAAARRDPDRDVEFAGRPAIRLLLQAKVHGPDGPEQQPDQEYYLDRETGEPLGKVSLTAFAPSPDGPDAGTSMTIRSVTTVKTLEELPPSAANLAKLRELTLPRRRDADGCIRGAVTAAHPNGAPRRDCGGGKPGAPIG